MRIRLLLLCGSMVLCPALAWAAESGAEPAPAEPESEDQAAQRPVPGSAAIPGEGAVAPFPPPPGAAPDPLRYLDAVRAQREALVERRHETARERSEALREEIAERRARSLAETEARRRAHDPRGEHLSSLSRHRSLAAEAQSEALREELDRRAEAAREQMERMHDQHEAWIEQRTPFGWGNPWYYRGY